MSAITSTQDHFVNVSSRDPALLKDLAKDQQALERFACNFNSLMALGEKLFRLAFPTSEEVIRLASHLATAFRAGATLRLWLHTPDDGPAALLPWEYLCLTQQAVEECRVQGYDVARHQQNPFLALHPGVSVVRQGGSLSMGSELARIGKLRVLVVWADPNNSIWGAIAGLESEVAGIRKALIELPASHVEWDVVEHATPEMLKRRVGEFRPHVLHYAGHGAFPRLDDPGDGLTGPALVLEGAHSAEGRRHAYFTDVELRSLCADVGVQVVVLNSCWGAKATRSFPGMARTLTSTEGRGRAVPVVVAHQMPVPQAAAAGFARPFYQKLVIGCPLEDGVRAFRRECLDLSPNGAGAPDWGIPVVYLGTQKTHLFRYERVDLYPLDFGQIIREHVPIVGRKFIREALARFQNERKSGVFLLTAPPGLGKTAFVSQLVEDDPTAIHFFYRAAAGMTDPDVWVKSMYQGLLGRYGQSIGESNPTNDRVELRTRLGQWLLPEVSKVCASAARRELILLDALDESGLTAADHKSALDVLPERLPDHVYLLVTSRPGPLADACAAKYRSMVTEMMLDPASASNREDAAGFVVRELRTKVENADESALMRLGEMLATRAEGNFLVLKLFMGREPLRGRVSVADVEREAANLSGEVDNEYRIFFDRATNDIRNSREDMKLLNRVLGAFVTAREPITQEQVSAAFEVDLEDWEWAFWKVRQFLAGGGLRQQERGVETYRIYHETFREYLRKKLASRLVEFQERWAEHALEWREHRGYARLYALRHVVSHLVAAGKG